MAAGKEWKTAFRTCWFLEYTVMPFGLTNASASFQHYVNDCLKVYLDVFCITYLNDILIYSDNISDYKLHVGIVLPTLKNKGVLLKSEKCQFQTKITTYLSLIISPSGISMDPSKLKAVQKWNTPKKVKDIQTFLGFANFSQRYILSFTKVANPLRQLTRKDLAST